MGREIVTPNIQILQMRTPNYKGDVYQMILIQINILYLSLTKISIYLINIAVPQCESRKL